MSSGEQMQTGNEDFTIMVPRPGGYVGEPAAVAPPTPERRPLSAPMQVGSGLNPVVRAASPLLNLVTPLRSMISCADLESLRLQLVEAVKKFEHDLRNIGVDPELVAAARYILCTFVDEAVSGTPWGGNGVWATRSLLVHFHNEAWGGEKTFVILQKLSQNPRASLDVLELIYLCLALGLEGRYRIREGGRDQLETLRERLHQLIRSQRAPYERELSPHWRGLLEQHKALLGSLPLWVLASAAAALFVALHLGLTYVLNRASDPVFMALHRIHLLTPAPQVQPVAAPSATPVVRLSSFLVPEIAQGLVSVIETESRSTVILRGDGVFASGSAEVISGMEPLIARIGEALKAVPGQVIVVGHTDDVPSFSARYPSNWDLSKARAASVLQRLAVQAGPETRYSLVGRGETEPLVPNDSASNRARNRRVDITLLTPGIEP